MQTARRSGRRARRSSRSPGGAWGGSEAGLLSPGLPSSGLPLGRARNSGEGSGTACCGWIFRDHGASRPDWLGPPVGHTGRGWGEARYRTARGRGPCGARPGTVRREAGDRAARGWRPGPGAAGGAWSGRPETLLQEAESTPRGVESWGDGRIWGILLAPVTLELATETIPLPAPSGSKRAGECELRLIVSGCDTRHPGLDVLLRTSDAPLQP